MSAHLETLHPLRAFSTKSPSSTLTSMKIKTLIHTLIVSHLCRIARSLSKVKSILVQILKDNRAIVHILSPHSKNKSSHCNFKHKKIFLGSFRLHYNWGSTRSHVMPVPAPVYDEISADHLYYDPTWNTVIATDGGQSTGTTDQGRVPLSQRSLSGYLQWLDQEKSDNGERGMNEIDKLADLFIANCHEKFILEKQESDRKLHEMLARSL